MKTLANKKRTASPAQLRRVRDAEQALVGTDSYRAQYAWFHNHEYRHYLRDVSKSVYLRVYRAFLKAGLDPAGESDQHLEIIREITVEAEIARSPTLAKFVGVYDHE